MKNIPTEIYDEIYKRNEENIRKQINNPYATYEESEIIELIEDSVNEELDYYLKIKNLNTKGIEKGSIEKIFSDAKNKYQDYEKQYDYIIKQINVYKTDKNISALKDLYIDIENIIGGECYHDSIQNYWRWGELLDEGRFFKYPFKYYKDGKKIDIKTYRIQKWMTTEEILSIYYLFGKNQLFIGRGIFRVLEYLENRYDLDFVELEKKLKIK